MARADSMALKKPNVWRTYWMSLSMVLGNAHDGDRQPAARDFFGEAWEPFWVPSPPTHRRMVMPRWTRKSTISATSCWPREEDRMVPPSRWMWSDQFGGQGERRFGLEGEALVALADAEDFAHAVVVVQFEKSERMTLS
jgi:hypothetical protein